MKTFRKIIFWLHLCSGVLAGIFIFIMCVTGALLAFEPNIMDWAESDQKYVKPPTENAPKIPVKQLVEKVVETNTETKPSSVVIENDPNAAVIVSLGREGKFYVNPYTGEITGSGAEGWHDFFGFFENLHRWLALSGDGRTVGKSLNDAANLLFLFLAISGLYIWFPRNLSWRSFKAVLWFRRGLRGKARNFNWHNTIGFWTSLVLIILTLTGAIISYQWAGNLLYTLTGNEVPQQQPRPPNQTEKAEFILPENLDEMFARAENHTNWKTLSLRLPVTNDSAVFTIDEGIYWNRFGRSTLTIDAKTLEVSKWETYGEQNAARQLRSWARFTHTGETFGFVGQFIALLACIGGAFLVWTGISLALRRLNKWRSKNSNGEI